MSPQDGVFDAECIEKGECLKRGPVMKIKRHLAGAPSRVSITGAIWNQNVKPAFQFRNLPVERINPVAPSAVKNHNGSATTKFPVVNVDWTNAGCMRRLRQLQSGHF